MSAAFFLQPYKAKGDRLVSLAATPFAYLDEALAEAKRLARWRAGIVVHRMQVDDVGHPVGKPVVLAIHGRVPDGWLAARTVAV